jgi:hypothetical protein
MANENIEDVIKKVILGEGFLAENPEPTEEPTEAQEGEDEVVEEEVVEEEYEGELEEAKEEDEDESEDEESEDEAEEEDADEEDKPMKKFSFKKKEVKEAASDYASTDITHDVNKKGAKIPEPHNANAGKNMATIKAKKSNANGKVEKPSVKESIETLFAGKELSEEFMSEAETLFEAQLAARTNEIEGELQAKYETLLEEHTLAVTEEMVERIDEYLNYVVEEWMQENRLAVDNGLRTEITEGFIERLKGVFAESYIEIPEEKLDLFESTVEDYESLKSELDGQVAKNMEINEECEQLRCELLFREMAEGLTDTETQKLRDLAESVEFESVEQFADKLAVLRENIENIGSTATESAEEETLEESYEEGSEDASPLMEAYLKSMSKSKD